MTAALDDPFDLDAPPGPQRDRWGRPCLIPAGKTAKDRTAYTRISTLSGFVADDFGLSTWKLRLAAVGLAQREDLCAMIAALPPLNDLKCDKTTLTKAQKDQDADTKAKLDSYLELAHDVAGGNYKANYGTAVHGFIEHDNAEAAPERMAADAQSALDGMAQHGIEVICSEVFVANDEIMAAGSFDHLVRHPTLGIVVADVKTGMVTGKALQFAVQMAGYVNGEVYDCETDTRAPLESLTGGERINRNIGLLVHVPLGGKRTEFYRVDLMRGRHLARLATHVRSARKLDDLMKPLEMTS
jgi:hypothetical protein